MTGNYGRPLSSPRSPSGPLGARPTAGHSTPRSGHHAAPPSGEKGKGTSKRLIRAERWWRAHQPWLQRCGYLFRAGYRQDWIPSWRRKGFFSKLKLPWRKDTIKRPATPRKIAATRTSDGLPVHLYLVSLKRSPDEADIMLHLTSGRLAGVSDPWENHTMPVIEVLDVVDDPELCIIVMPLMRRYDDPRLKTMGEAVDFLGQILEGMKFMHTHGIAHRNPQLCGDAIMCAPAECYPEVFRHAATKMNSCCSGEAFKHARTKKPVTYYFADLRVAKRYRMRSTSPTSSRRSKQKLRWEDEVGVMDYPLRWKGNFAPEFVTPEKKCDPFKVDVYLLGIQISKHFIREYLDFGWLRPLVDDMCQKDPKLRITMAEAYVRFLWLSASVSTPDLAENLITMRRRETVRRVVRKWKKKLGLQGLLREMRSKNRVYPKNPPRPTGGSWLPIHSV